MDRQVAVIGSGTWGTAASDLVAPHAEKVILWARRPEVAEAICATHRNPQHLPDLELPENVIATSSLAEAFDGASSAVLVVPSAFLRSVCEQAAPYVAADLPIVVLTKGIEPSTGLSMVGVAADVLGNPERVAALSGPNHAEEIAQHQISAAVIAAQDVQLAQHFQRLFTSPTFRAYASDDLVGVEVCAATKNVVALAAGMAVGLGMGDNTLAVLMTRGLAEIGRISAACGGDPLTCMGLAGMGDLVATCTSPHSRNRSFGVAFAQGESLAEYEQRTGMVVEGAQAARSVWELAHRLGVEAPITEAVHAVLYRNCSLEDATDRLLGRRPFEEFYGME